MHSETQAGRESLKTCLSSVRSASETDNEGLTNGRGNSLGLQSTAETALNSK